ncbi:MAG: HAMP domain-containing histidine kinase [Nitrosarchaeum sp.]|nr:HAMP domain-containing histidine kinase [Nitrosarchaeum sp.]
MSMFGNLFSSYSNKSLILLVASLVFITAVYQFRSFLDDQQFAWISVLSYSVIPAVLVVFSSVLTIKLHKIKHFQAKAFLLFAIGASMWFIAEQIWAVYDHVFDEDPFPSIADVFFISSYPFYISFLMISLRPIWRSIPKKVWLFAIVFSSSLLIPSILACIDALGDQDAFDKTTALVYPILSSIQLVPALVGIMFLTKKKASYTWMLLLFGFLMFSASDTFFLFAQINESYYDGHPVDLMFLFSFILLTFSLHSRLKIVDSPETTNELFFTENVQFETITRYGIPLSVVIISMIVVIFLISEVYIVHNVTEILHEDHDTLDVLMIGIFVILLIFSLVILVLNSSLSKLVQMRTTELENQKNNLQKIVLEKQEELLKSERLSAIGELSGRLAHDLRNPLSVIKMAVDLIKQYPAHTKISDDVVTKRIDLIEKSIQRISHQIDDVLGYVRKSPLELASISIKDTLLNAIDKIDVPSNVKIILSDKDAHIPCDAIKMDAVFINIITNSIQAMDDGGTIAIDISSHDDYVMIEFTDTGSGIPEDQIDKIFEPLFTTKQKGTGLGLSICKNIVEQHGGQISVRNNPTTFVITLPKKINSVPVG